MMHVVLQRAWSDSRATLGMIKIMERTHDPFFTLENPLRKTDFDSRIPAGKYMCSPYSGTKYKNVYILKDVPGRSAILIHSGNFESQTQGCILLGLGSGMLMAEPAVTGSKDALEAFRLLIGRENFILKVVDEVKNL